VKVFNYLIIYVGRPARALPAVYPIRHNGARLKLLLNNPPIRTHPMRIFNFSAGPAVLPEPVLRRAAAEMLDWHGSGMSVMEMSHRGREFTRIAEKTQADFRQLLAIPANYKVLFLQGGALAMNAFIPMNLLGSKTSADIARCMLPRRRKIAHLPMCHRSRPGNSIVMRPMSMCAPTRRSVASNITGCRRQGQCRWWRICPRIFCRV